MANCKVLTTSRFAQWTIYNFGPSSHIKSESFNVGLWNWVLILEKSDLYFSVRLSLEPSEDSSEQPPSARFTLRLSDYGPNSKPYLSPVYEKYFETSKDFVWSVDENFCGGITVNVEFLDLKMAPHIGGELKSIWNVDAIENISTQTTLERLSRVFSESMHADATIIMTDGSLSAHKAILSASSQVFQNMFHHDLSEKESSTIQIEDVSFEICAVLLSYLYGTIRQEDFWKHRVSLLRVANKYLITDLKDACEESLMEDINPNNLFDRLNEAWLYQLDKLKQCCMIKLFQFGQMYSMTDDVRIFCTNADKELLAEILQEIFSIWRFL